MRVALVSTLLFGCASEPSHEEDPPECPYDFSAPVDADTGNTGLDEFLETAPEVDAEVRRIDDEVRAGCAAIGTDLGGDATDLGTIEACDLAGALIALAISSNPDVSCVLVVDPETEALTLSCSGTAADPALLDALVATIEAHLDLLLIEAEAAEVAEQIAQGMLALDIDADVSADEAACITAATDVYTNAIAVCAQYVSATAALGAATSG